MKVGIVVHGPHIIDSGYAVQIINHIADSLGVNKGNLNCIIGGTTGRTAVIDAGLENIIDISEKRLPSESIKFLQSNACEIIFLIHYGKSATTGHVFGLKVFQNSHKPPLIEIERPGEFDGSVISWDSNFSNLANDIANNLNLNLINPNEIINKYNDNGNNNEIRRKIHGVSPNENILINGIFVGISNGTEIVLVANNNILTEIIGADFEKEFGDKLGKIDLNNAIVKTGLLRNSNVNGKVKNIKFEHNDQSLFKIGFIDNPLTNTYAFKNNNIIITIGDESTLLTSDSLYRFNIPIIGIITGAVENLVSKTYIHNESVIIKVTDTPNDKKMSNLNSKINHISDKIKSNIFNGNIEYCYSNGNNRTNNDSDNNDIINTLTNQIVNIIIKNDLNCEINNKIAN